MSGFSRDGPNFKAGERVSAGKLNKLSGAVDAAGVTPGPGVHGDQGPQGTWIRDTRYRRVTIGRTGGASYPAATATISIDTEFPFEFVDIDNALTPIVKERGDAAFVCYNLSLTHIAADTLIVLVEHRGAWYTQTGAGGDGSTSMWFTVTAVECDADSVRYLVVTPNRVAPPCVAVPGADAYGAYNVYDDGFLCILGEYTDAELIGLRGKATYASDVDQTYGCVKGWTLDGLCDVGSC